MRVAHINTFGRYSTGNIAGDILSALPSDSGKLLIYGIEDSKYPFAKKIGSKVESFFHIALNRLFGRHGRYSYFNTLKIINELEKFNPDIVHLHNLHGYYMDYVPLFKYLKKNNIKVVWTLHDCWPFTGYCPHFDRIGCEKWKTMCNKCPANYKEGYMKSYIFDTSKEEFLMKKKSFLGLSNMVLVSPSEWLANFVKESFLKEYPITVINNGIDINKFNFTDKHSFDNIIDRSKKIVLGVAAPFEESKGFNDFIKLAEILPQEYQIVMVGLDEDRMKRIPKNIVGIKKTKNQEELTELYSIADVFVNMTYQDNYPTVNLEALSCGTPVITYNTGGSIESITKNNGLIIEQGNLILMKEAIERACNYNYERDVISREAKIKYSKEVMVQKYLKLYQEVLAKNG